MTSTEPEYEPAFRTRVVPRPVFCLALSVYCAGLMAFALTPTHSITGWEISVAIVAGIALLGLFAWSTPGFSLPAENYAYLVTGAAGLWTNLAYLLDTDGPSGMRLWITLLLSAGVIGSYGAYLADPPIHRRRE